MRRYKNWAHKISSWEYLTIWRPVQPVFPDHRVPHFCSPSWTPFRGCGKVSSCSSTWFNPCESRRQVPMASANLWLTMLPVSLPVHCLLQIAVKRREVKSKGEKKRYVHLNAEFQRIARRDKKAFLTDQCKEIEENNRMGKIRDLFKKIRDTKGTFHAKMGSIKDRNGMNLKEAEDKKRWQEYTEGEGEVAQSCPTLCDPVDCSLPGFSIHGIFQARILEWVTISFSRGSSRPRDQTRVSCIGGRHFNLWATREAQNTQKNYTKKIFTTQLITMVWSLT